MPNHIHGVIALSVGATLAVAQNQTVAQNDTDRRSNPCGCPDVCDCPDNARNDDAAGIENRVGATIENRAGASPAPTVGNIVGAYKSLSANECLKIFKSKNEYMGKLWQRNYYEHIIRDDDDYARIAEYIENNPRNWDTDKFYIQ